MKSLFYLEDRLSCIQAQSYLMYQNILHHKEFELSLKYHHIKFGILSNESDGLADQLIWITLPCAVLEQWVLLYLPSHVSFSRCSIV